MQFARGQECYAADNYSKAYYWYREAAELGHAEAALLLGYMSYVGLGVPEDRATAARWYESAAERGSVDAAVLLGRMYESGSGIAVNLAAAARMYIHAALHGHSGAAFLLKRLNGHLVCCEHYDAE